MTLWRMAAWAAFLVPLAVTAGSIFREQLLRQPVWTDAGHDRLLIYLTVFAVWTAVLRRFRPEMFVCATAAVGLIYACCTVGLTPVAAVSLVLIVAWVSGRSLLANAPGDLVAIATGLAVIIFVISLAVTVRVNYVWTYAGVFMGVLAVRWRTTVQILSGAARLWRPGSGAGHAERLFIELLGLVLFAHLLLVLKPEAGADGLAMHLAIPAQVYNHGLWDFNFRHAVWAVMPMAGDWLYTAGYMLGGEFGARLLNYSALLLSLSLLYALSRTFTTRTVSLAVVILFASSPLVQMVTGSLFVENVWTALIIAALAAVARYHTSRDWRYLFAASVLLGCAISGKFGAFSFVLPVLAFVCIDLVRRRRLTLLAPVVALIVMFAAPPYVTAWVKTGNPMFPFFNAFFRSPYFDAAVSFTDDRFRAGLHFDTLWQISFRTSRFLESSDGAVGLQYFLFVPLTIVAAVTRRWPYAGTLALVSGVSAFVLLFSAQSNARYVYPAMAVISVAIGAAFERFRTSLPSLYHTALGATVGVVAFNFYFLAAAGWWHRDFFLSPFDASERQRYVESAAGERLLIDRLNRQARGEPVLFAQSTAHAQLNGTAYTNSWHHMSFLKKLNAQSNALDVLRLLETTNIRWIVHPCPEAGAAFEQVSLPLQWFLGDYTQQASRAGRFCLARTRHEFEGPEGVGHAERVAEQQDPAATGVYDDFSRHVRTRGTWTRDRQFAEAHAATLTYSGQPGDSVLFKFNGRKLCYTATRAENRGIAELIVDGRLLASIDLYAPRTQWQSQHVLGGLREGTHLLEIRVSARRNRASTGFFVDVDALTVN